MISMLSKFEKMLEKWLHEVKVTISNKTENTAHLTKKEINLTNQLTAIRNNKAKLEQTILS